MDQEAERRSEASTTSGDAFRHVRPLCAGVLAGCLVIWLAGCGSSQDVDVDSDDSDTDSTIDADDVDSDSTSDSGFDESTDVGARDSDGSTGAGRAMDGARADAGGGPPRRDGGAVGRDVRDAGSGEAPLPVDAGSDTDDIDAPRTDGGSGGDVDASCPEGFESRLPLVLAGMTVPGNLELGLASAPETPRAPCGLTEEQICFDLINAEREKAGKAPFLWDGDLADLGRSHAADRTQRRYPGTQHGSSTSDTHLYQQRAEFLGLKRGKFRSVVENACKGARTGERAFQCWMSSSGHRAVMLGEGSWASLKYAACGYDGSEWNLELAF